MSDISTAIRGLISSQLNGIDFTDLTIGTVETSNPLSIRISADYVIPEVAILLTEPVLEKKLVMETHRHSVTGLGHTHTVMGSTTSQNLTGNYPTTDVAQLGEFYIDGIAQPIDRQNNTIIMNEGLKIGDSVIMLRCLDGQKFVVLSKIYNRNGG